MVTCKNNQGKRLLSWERKKKKLRKKEHGDLEAEDDHDGRREPAEHREHRVDDGRGVEAGRGKTCEEGKGSSYLHRMFAK